MKKLVSALFSATLSVFPAPAQAHHDGGSQFPERRIAIVGDSHVEALGPELWSKFAEMGIGCQFKKERGSRAEGWVGSQALNRWLAEFDPQIVIVSFGTNEGMAKSTVEHLAASFRALAEQLKNRRPDRRIIWIAPPPFSKVPYLANVYAALSKTKGIEVPDFSKNVYNENETGAHLTRPAYRALADDIRIWLRDHP